MNLTINKNIIKINLNEHIEKNIIIEENLKITSINNNLSIQNNDRVIIDNLVFDQVDDKWSITIKSSYENVYGLGERFDRINQKGQSNTVHIIEQFCNQGSISYCPIPFFFTDNEYGVYVDTLVITEYDFADDITIRGTTNSDGSLPDIYILLGNPADVISAYSRITGRVKLPPKWAFGTWMSGNRWNKQSDIEEQIELYKKYNLPANVIVIEAWSDECTFYIWNGAATNTTDANSNLWEDPKEMIAKLNDMGIKLILWQIPVFKKLDHEISEQHDIDCAYAIENKLCVMNQDGTPYTIPKGHWFEGSMIPDFTNPDTIKWWFDRRQYLLDMGVSGFKTDGGEFIYTEDTIFQDGSTSKEMKNGYAKSYVKAYNDFIGDEGVLFSRAGYAGQHSFPIQWAGDQQSTWSELRSILNAGLSSGLSGIVFWSYDIGGFAGPLPTVELYERSTQLAVFTPVMQWHSEPSGGQFAELMPSAEGINDRSPWNMASVYKDENLIERLRFHYNLRTNLLPYIYSCAKECSVTGLPLMRHLVVNYPDDKNVYNIDDQFMLGDILVAPVVEENQTVRKVYLPSGEWKDLYSSKIYKGNAWYDIECGYERIPAFVRIGSAIALNLGDDFTLGSYVGNSTTEYKNLCILITGDSGEYSFNDDTGIRCDITWNNGEVSITGEHRDKIKIIK